jgi:hypothetical protein
MRRAIWALAVVVICGCQTHDLLSRSPADDEMFGPVSMRLHPTFTEVKDWTGDNKPDGIEAVVELQDQFGDTTRATGKVVFELYGYRFAAPDPKGERVGGPWIGALLTTDDQIARWNTAIRGYSFQLADPTISKDRSYVLTAEFDLGARGRLFDQVVIEGQNEKGKRAIGRRAVHAPEQTPSH